MDKNQRRAFITVVLMALLALPIYVIVGVVTAPIGIGILMLMKTDWIITLYPFMFAGKGHWSAPVYYLAPAISLPLTIVQWISIAWLSSFVLRDLKPRRLVLRALALIVVVGIATSVILWAAGITLMPAPTHT